MVVVPTFADSLREAERRLSRLLGGRCEVSVHTRLDEGLLVVLEAIDHEKFRQELRYDRGELESRGGRRGFLCLVAWLDGGAVAFDYGYDGEEEGTFYSDTTATLVEGRGVGSTLFALEIIRSYELGHARTRLSTEEVDEVGRPLRRIWGRLGFEVVSTDSSGGIEMEMAHTPEGVRSLYDRYVSDSQPSS